MMNHVAPFLGKEVEKQLDELGGELMEIECALQEEDNEGLRYEAKMVRRKMSALLQGEDPEPKRKLGCGYSYKREKEALEARARKDRQQRELCEKFINMRVTILEREDESDMTTETEVDVIQIVDHYVLVRRVDTKEFMLILDFQFAEKFEDDEIRINLSE